MPKNRGYSEKLRSLGVGESFTVQGDDIHPYWWLSERWRNACSSMRSNEGTSLRIRVRTDRKANTVTITRVPDVPVVPRKEAA